MSARQVRAGSIQVEKMGHQNAIYNTQKHDINPSKCIFMCTTVRDFEWA